LQKSLCDRKGFFIAAFRFHGYNEGKEEINER